MGIPSELRDAWVSKRNSFIIASPDEERKILRTKKCTNGILHFHSHSFLLISQVFLFNLNVNYYVSHALCWLILIINLLVDDYG